MYDIVLLKNILLERFNNCKKIIRKLDKYSSNKKGGSFKKLQTQTDSINTNTAIKINDIHQIITRYSDWLRWLTTSIDNSLAILANNTNTIDIINNESKYEYINEGFDEELDVDLIKFKTDLDNESNRYDDILEAYAHKLDLLRRINANHQFMNDNNTFIFEEHKELKQWMAQTDIHIKSFKITEESKYPLHKYLDNTRTYFNPVDSDNNIEPFIYKHVVDYHALVEDLSKIITNYESKVNKNKNNIDQFNNYIDEVNKYFINIASSGGSGKDKIIMDIKNARDSFSKYNNKQISLIVTAREANVMYNMFYNSILFYTNLTNEPETNVYIYFNKNLVNHYFDILNNMQSKTMYNIKKSKEDKKIFDYRPQNNIYIIMGLILFLEDIQSQYEEDVSRDIINVRRSNNMIFVILNHYVYIMDKYYINNMLNSTNNISVFLNLIDPNPLLVYNENDKKYSYTDLSGDSKINVDSKTKFNHIFHNYPYTVSMTKRMGISTHLSINENVVLIAIGNDSLKINEILFGTPTNAGILDNTLENINSGIHKLYFKALCVSGYGVANVSNNLYNEISTIKIKKNGKNYDMDIEPFEVKNIHAINDEKTYFCVSGDEIPDFSKKICVIYDKFSHHLGMRILIYYMYIEKPDGRVKYTIIQAPPRNAVYTPHDTIYDKLAMLPAWYAVYDPQSVVSSYNDTFQDSPINETIITKQAQDILCKISENLSSNMLTYLKIIFDSFNENASRSIYIYSIVSNIIKKLTGKNNEYKSQILDYINKGAESNDIDECLNNDLKNIPTDSNVSQQINELTDSILNQGDFTNTYKTKYKILYIIDNYEQTPMDDYIIDQFVNIYNVLYN
jgi:hypothetical protein